MRLTVNGQHIETFDVETVLDLLNKLCINPERVAVEVNLSVVKKANYSTFTLKDGDRVEIVNFVGGG